MAVLNKQEFLEAIKQRVGDDTSDETLKFIEDMTNTYEELETNAAEALNYKQKYEDNDKSWREKYKNAFFSGNPTPAPAPDPAEPVDKPMTYESLFTIKS